MAVATARASKRLVHFVDEMGIKCWGALAAGVAQPRPGEVVPLAACPVTASCAMGEVGSRRTIKELLPALPVERPAVICIGLNYKAHAAECGMPEPRLPVVFFKNPASVTGDGGPIEVPKCAQDPLEVDYEIELGVVIAKDCKDVSAKDALSYVLGYGVCERASRTAVELFMCNECLSGRVRHATLALIAPAHCTPCHTPQVRGSERCVGAGVAGGARRVAVVPRQELRHLLPGGPRAGAGRGLRPHGAARLDHGERRGAPGQQHLRPHLLRARRRRLPLAGHHASGAM